MLAIKNITFDQPFKKLDHKMLGFFEVIGNKRVFVELQLLQSIKIYNVFHSNLLQKASTDPLTNQVNKLPPPVIINNKEKCKIEDILNAENHRVKV